MPLPRHVTPVSGAQIPDPAADDMLPPEGRTVIWSEYWAEAHMHGDILVSDPGEPAPDPDADPEA